jgi:hypothetical protein
MRRHDIPEGAVYIGRPGPWGNQFGGLPRGEAIAKHRAWVLASPDVQAKAKCELRGRTLVCWCKPKACHGDVLLEVANT